MPTFQDIPADLKRPDIDVVEVGDGIFFKAMRPHYNTFGSMYGAGLDSPGVQELHDGGLPLYGTDVSVWWVDVALWPHLRHPLTHSRKTVKTAAARPEVAMKWDILSRVMIWTPPAGPRGSRIRIALAGARVLTIEAESPPNFIRARRLGDRLAELYGDCIDAHQYDPRHIGTHWGFDDVGNIHLHLLRASMGSWIPVIRTVADEATRLGLVHAREKENFINTLLGNPVPAAVSATATATTTTTAPVGSAPPGPQPAAQPQLSVPQPPPA